MPTEAVKGLQQDLKRNMSVVLHPSAAASPCSGRAVMLQCDSLLPEHCVAPEGPVHLTCEWLYDSAAQCVIQPSEAYSVQAV